LTHCDSGAFNDSVAFNIVIPGFPLIREAKAKMPAAVAITRDD